VIKSQWDVDHKGKSERDVDRMLRSNYVNSIVDQITREFMKSRSGCSFWELKNAALEGFWRAFSSYDPKKGKFTNHANYVCRSYIQDYYRRAIITEDPELFETKTHGSVVPESSMVDRITVMQVLSRLTERERRVITTSFLDNDYNSRGDIKKITKILKLSRFQLYTTIQRIFKKVRQSCIRELTSF
jgi:RNA polymerase sigma factor (sigma-70 family)